MPNPKVSAPFYALLFGYRRSVLSLGTITPPLGEVEASGFLGLIRCGRARTEVSGGQIFFPEALKSNPAELSAKNKGGVGAYVLDELSIGGGPWECLYRLPRVSPMRICCLMVKKHLPPLWR